MGVRVFVIQRPISRNEVSFPLEPKHTGAILEYFHVVRDHEADRPVRSMRFDADRESLREELLRIGKKVTTEYDLTDFECFRRVGEVAAGEPCLLVRVAAPHAHEVFRAMNEFLEEIKQLPIQAEAV